MSSLLSSLGPAIARASAVEAVRAGAGTAAALAVVGLFLLAPGLDLRLGLSLIPPFGASALLLFAVPNSPLAQPWSVVVGNTLAALVGVSACLLVPDPALRVALAVGVAATVLLLFRAVHPPAGAVAMTAALNPDAVAHLGYGFALTPVAVGSIALVLLAVVYNRLTGRTYPLRQFDDPNRHRTQDRAPMERMGLSEKELSDILTRYRQSFNLGVEDLARLIGAAEMQAATHRTGPLTAADIMSRNLVTIGPDTPLSRVADLFRIHRFTSLPVVAEGDRFLGVIFQLHLIARARSDALRLHRGFGATMRRLLDRRRDQPVRAQDIMLVAGPRATPATPIGALLPMMANGEVDAVPVLKNGRIEGIVTRTDLITALARSSLHAPTDRPAAPQDQNDIVV